MPTTHIGASLYDGIPSLANQAEEFITRAFYGKTAAEARQRAYAMGLQSPLWLWTHQQITRDGGAPKEMRKVLHLLDWLHRHGTEMARTAVLVPLSWKAMFKHEVEVYGAEVHIQEQPVILAHHELAALNKRDHTKYQYRAVIYLVDALPRNLSINGSAAAQPMPASEEKLISEAMGAATDAFILCADAGWMAPQLQASWYKTLVTKLQDVQPLISFDWTTTTESAMLASDARFPSLVGPSLPLCCSRHPNQRQLESGHSRIEPCCKHLCLCPYPCHRQDHICTRHCHPGEVHTPCPYACGKILSCGHKCLLTCSEPCNCFEVIEQPLSCSHVKIIGMNKETLEPIYTTIHHVFKGVCSDATLPCTVEYETECARCLDTFMVKCFEAQEQGHTLEHKVMICAACKRREREFRAKLLGELLTGAEAQRKKLKADLQRSLHHQRKAAARGLFRPGTRVEIVDASKCVPPLFAEDDFPGVEFADMESPSFFHEMDGAYGTFVSNHVDVMDRSEVRNLVRLPDGKHVLVTDGGLRMIQALTSSITSAAPLMLTFQDSGTADHQHHGEGKAEGANVDSAEFAAAKTMLHGTYYLGQPVPCDELPGHGVLTDKVVRVVDLDPLAPKHVVIACTLATVSERLRSLSEGGEEGDGRPDADDGEDKAAADASKRVLKRPRLDSGVTDTTRYDCVEQVIRLSVPITALEPMPGFVTGKYVFVNAPERQVRNPHDMVRLEALLQEQLAETQTAAVGAVAATPSAFHVTAAPIDPDTPYSLVTVVNPPVNCESVRGPCAVLKCNEGRVMGRAKMTRGAVAAHRRFSNHTALPPLSPSARTLLVVVPFMFIVGDELAEAEGALDAAAQRALEQRLHTELTAANEELALKHEEAAFHAQQQMPEVTVAMLATKHHAVSIPVPLPSAGAAAAAKKTAMELAVGSPIATRLAHTKDKLVSKQESVQLAQWVTAMKERSHKDKESDAHHVKYIRSLKK